MTTKEEVLATYPTAYCSVSGDFYLIVRPKTAEDNQSSLNFVVLTGLHKTEGEAWGAAALLLPENK